MSDFPGCMRRTNRRGEGRLPPRDSHVASPLKALAFQSYHRKPQQVFCRRPVFVVDFPPRTIIFAVSRTDTERAAIVFAAWNGTRRSATMPGNGARGKVLSFQSGRGRRRCNGRTARVHVRATARTNGGTLAETAIPGTSSKPTNPSACGTQVRNCFRGPGSALAPSRAEAGPLPACRWISRTANGMPAVALRAAAEAASLPSVPHVPSGGDGRQQGRRALAPATSGAMTCVFGQASGCLTIEDGHHATASKL